MISMEKFKNESDVIVLGCGHVFMLDHLQQWLEFKNFVLLADKRFRLKNIFFELDKQLPCTNYTGCLYRRLR